MTAPTRNARVTDRNEQDLLYRLERFTRAEEDTVYDMEPITDAIAEIQALRTALATMTADRDRWRAQAEHSWPGKGSP